MKCPCIKTKNTNTASLTGDGSVYDPIEGHVIVSSTPGNCLQARHDGLYAECGEFGPASNPGAITVQIGPDPGTVAAPPVLDVQTRFFQLPASYEIEGWQVATDHAANLAIDLRYHAWPARPEAGDSILGSATVGLVGAKSGDGDVTGWVRTSLARRDWLAIKIAANDTATWVSLQLFGERT